MTITLTKKLPTEEGLYYWAPSKLSEVRFHKVYECFGEGVFYVCALTKDIAVEKAGGYWAKVDQSMFEVVDDD